MPLLSLLVIISLEGHTSKVLVNGLVLAREIVDVKIGNS